MRNDIKVYRQDEMDAADQAFSEWLQKINEQVEEEAKREPEGSRSFIYHEAIRMRRVQQHEPQRQNPTAWAGVMHIISSAKQFGIGSVKPRHIKNLLFTHAPVKLIACVLGFSVLAGAQMLPGVEAIIHPPIPQQLKQYHDTDRHREKKPKVKVELRIPTPAYEPPKVEDCKEDAPCDASAPWLFQPQER